MEKSAKIQKYALEENDLEKIKALTLADELNAEKLFVFKITLCDNEVDRDFEYFTDNALETLAELFKGKTGIFDHSMRAEHQVARIFDTEVVEDSGKETSYGVPYKRLVAKAYMVRCKSFEDLIEQIEFGIKKEVSISCSCKKHICSVCGADRCQQRCEHIAGREYDGKTCAVALDDVFDAYEFSFVAVPAQRAAGATKSADRQEEALPLDNGKEEREENHEKKEKSVLDSFLQYFNKKI